MSVAGSCRPTIDDDPHGVRFATLRGPRFPRVFATLNHLFEFSAPNPEEGLARLATRVRGFAREAEAVGCEGILVFAGSTTPDPWVLAQLILEETSTLRPLVAIQPSHAHPCAVFGRIATLSNIYGRRLCLNLVAGSNRRELLAIGDELDHDARYERMTEYGSILLQMTRERSPHRHRGKHYSYDGLSIFPELPVGLCPEVFVAGASEGARRAAAELDATWLRSPAAGFADDEVAPEHARLKMGLSIGFITRDSDAAAWAAARHFFPFKSDRARVPERDDRHDDSQWRRELYDKSVDRSENDTPLWLEPFMQKRIHWKHRRSNHPWLVGSHRSTARFLAPWLSSGVDTLVVYLEDGSEFAEIARALALATNESLEVQA